MTQPLLKRTRTAPIRKTRVVAGYRLGNELMKGEIGPRRSFESKHRPCGRMVNWRSTFEPFLKRWRVLSYIVQQRSQSRRALAAEVRRRRRRLIKSVEQMFSKRLPVCLGNIRGRMRKPPWQSFHNNKFSDINKIISKLY